MEYAFLVRTCDLPVSGPESSQFIARELAAMAEPLQRSLESFDNGGWHVISHDVTQVNGTLIVSFLMSRRERSL